MTTLVGECGSCKLFAEDSEENPDCESLEVRKGDKVFKFDKPFTKTTETITCVPFEYADRSHEKWIRENVRYRANDIVIVTHPKCGTTLMEQIVLLLLNGGDDEKLNPLIKNTRHVSETGVGKIWAESCVTPNDYARDYGPGRHEHVEFRSLPLDQYEAYPSPRLLKSHAMRKDILDRADDGSPKAAKYIIVTRNMFDACVSSYYHAWNPSEQGWEFDAWALLWFHMGPEPNVGTYFDWHKGWFELKDQLPPKEGGTPETPEILWTHYEDIVSAPRDYVEKVAKFIGVEDSPELIDKVVEGSSFRKMKEMAKKKAEQQGHGGDQVGHLRSGKSGGWRSKFTPELEQLFREKYKETLSPLGLKYNIGDGEILD